MNARDLRKNFIPKIQKEYKECFDDSRLKNDELVALKRQLFMLREAVQKQAQDSNTIKNETLSEIVSEFKLIGLTRLSMSNPSYFEKHTSAYKDYYGFPNFIYLKMFIEQVLEVPYIPPSDHTIQRGGGENLSEFEQILLTMFFCNTDFNFTIIGIVFGVNSRNTVSKYIKRWMPILGEVGDMLSSFTDVLDEEAYKKLEPKSYKVLQLENVAALVDGKDFLCETCRVDRVLNCAQASNKVNHSAFRILTWSLPCGAVIERTPVIFGRASEKSILRSWGELGRLQFPKHWCIMGDKGFDGTAGYYTNYNTTFLPAFLTSSQFSRGDVNHNIKVCQKRYTCEVVYSRVTQVKKLSGVIKRETFPYVESLVGWGHGLANICYGYLQKVENNQE